MTNQRAGIDVADNRHANSGQKGVRRGIAAPVARDRRKLAHNKSFDEGSARFVIFRTCSVVANLRVCQDDNLSGIAWISEYFLIAGEGCVEYNLAGPLGGRTKAPALEDGPVFQGEDCRVQFRLFLPGSG